MEECYLFDVSNRTPHLAFRTLEGVGRVVEGHKVKRITFIRICCLCKQVEDKSFNELEVYESLKPTYFWPCCFYHCETQMPRLAHRSLLGPLAELLSVFITQHSTWTVVGAP